MNHKKVVQEQNYEDYWKLTLGTTDIFGNQFIRTLKSIVDHIDRYELADKTIDDLTIKSKDKKEIIRLNQSVTHSKELEEQIKKIYKNDDVSGASTRKQINQYIKLGFIKPYLQGYCQAAKEYYKVKPNKYLNNEEQKKQYKETLQRLFSDTVYEHASFNSSRIKADPVNQIKFLVQTILNRRSHKLNANELIGLMNDTEVLSHSYAREKTIEADRAWAESIGFKKRKYNQIAYVYNILSKMSMFKVMGEKLSDKEILLADNASLYIPKKGDTKRDQYRFSLMREAVYKESEARYHRKQCWLTGYHGHKLVVSHLYSSAAALSNYENDAAYDPQNALLLAPGDPDYYVDKYKMTFDANGNPIFSAKDHSSFVKEVCDKHYKIDKEILTKERLKYLKIHNEEFEEVNHQKIN